MSPVLAYLALAAAVTASAAAQILLKLGSATENIAGQIFDPRTVGGLALYGAGAVFYILALRKIPLSVAFPSAAGAYVIVTVISIVAFKEAFSLVQAGGLALIIAGVLMLHVH